MRGNRVRVFAKAKITQRDRAATVDNCLLRQIELAS